MAGGGRVPRFDRHHAGADEALEELLDLVVQQRIVDRGRGLAAQGREQLLVLGGEGLPVLLVQRLHHADHVAIDGAHGHAEDGLGLVAGLLVDVLVEARILVRVGNVDRRVGGGHRPGDAAVHGDADLLHAAQPLRHLGPQLAALAVDEEQGAAVGFDDARAGVDDQLEQPVEVPLGDEGFGDLENPAELLDALLQPVHGAEHSIRSVGGVCKTAHSKVRSRRASSHLSGSTYRRASVAASA